MEKYIKSKVRPLLSLYCSIKLLKWIFNCYLIAMAICSVTIFPKCFYSDSLSLCVPQLRDIIVSFSHIEVIIIIWFRSCQCQNINRSWSWRGTSHHTHTGTHTHTNGNISIHRRWHIYALWVSMIFVHWQIFTEIHTLRQNDRQDGTFLLDYQDPIRNQFENSN